MKLCFLLSDKSDKEQSNCIQLNTEIKDKSNLILVLPIPAKVGRQRLHTLSVTKDDLTLKEIVRFPVTEISRSEVHHQNCRQQRIHSSGKTKYYFWKCQEFQSREHNSNKNWTSSASNRHWIGKLKDFSWQAARKNS